MTPQDAERAAELLAAARRDARQAALDGALRPATIEDAYAIQAALAKRSGAVKAWKIVAVGPKQREALKIDRPIAAPIWGSYVHQSPARLPLAKFLSVILEAEFDFILGRDLPPRAKPYTEDEVAAAVKELRPAIEIVDSRIGRPHPAHVMLADCYGNGGLVLGAPLADWRGLDLQKHAVTLKVDGKAIATGNGAAIPGGPLSALVVAANTPAPWSGGLKAGQAVTTGSCTGMPALASGREVVAEFGTLGDVRVSFT